jgi:uncharacterized protein
MNSKQEIIRKTTLYVKKTMKGEGAHDWWHIYRVWKCAKFLSHKENVDSFLPELTALLHDIADWKFYGGDETKGPKLAGEWLRKQRISKNDINIIQEAIHDVSFMGAGVAKKPHTIVGEIVQDADRLDALGAIGIARTFSYGGHAGVLIFDPKIKPVLHKTKEAYKESNSPTINHFYEKLLLLKNQMNTKSAKKIALKRHTYMEKFLKEFYTEWKLKDVKQS